MKWPGFGNQCILALILGLVFGHFMPNSVVQIITPFGSAFLKLLKLVIVPLTFSTIVASFANLENITIAKKLGVNTLIWFVITALFASIIGVLIGSIINPGIGLSLDPNIVTNFKAREVPTITNIFLDMLPGNLIKDIANDKIIPLILFAVFFGLALTALQDKGKHIKVFFDEFSQVMFKLTRFIIRLSPIGIFALIAEVSNQYGLSTLLPLGKFIAAIYLACFMQLLVYTFLIIFIGKKNPVEFFKQFWPAMITAFTTSSSLGTLPITLETLVERVKIKKQVAGFVGPLSATMKMDGCGAIYPAIVCIFTINLFHLSLNLEQYIIIILTSAIATIGTAGIPGTASIMATVVLLSIGLPLEGLALVIGIDKIVDMIRTMVNVTGGGVCAVIVDKKYSETPSILRDKF